jgi:adenylyltransferase/sulfurtransferase
VLGAGETLQGRLLLFDALGTTIDEVAIQRDPACPVCGDNPTITEYIDYVEFCQSPTSRPASAPAGRSPAPPTPAAAGGTSLSGSVQRTIPSGDAPPATTREAGGGARA